MSKIQKLTQLIETDLESAIEFFNNEKAKLFSFKNVYQHGRILLSAFSEMQESLVGPIPTLNSYRKAIEFYRDNHELLRRIDIVSSQDNYVLFNRITWFNAGIEKKFHDRLISLVEELIAEKSEIQRFSRTEEHIKFAILLCNDSTAKRSRTATAEKYESLQAGLTKLAKSNNLPEVTSLVPAASVRESNTVDAEAPPSKRPTPEPVVKPAANPPAPNIAAQPRASELQAATSQLANRISKTKPKETLPGRGTRLLENESIPHFNTTRKPPAAAKEPTNGPVISPPKRKEPDKDLQHSKKPKTLPSDLSSNVMVTDSNPKISVGRSQEARPLTLKSCLRKPDAPRGRRRHVEFFGDLSTSAFEQSKKVRSEQPKEKSETDISNLLKRRQEKSECTAKKYQELRELPGGRLMQAEKALAILMPSVDPSSQDECAELLRELGRFCRKEAIDTKFHPNTLLHTAKHLLITAKSWGNPFAQIELDFMLNHPEISRILKLDTRKVPPKVCAFSPQVTRRIVEETLDEVASYVSHFKNYPIFEELIAHFAGIHSKLSKEKTKIVRQGLQQFQDEQQLPVFRV